MSDSSELSVWILTGRTELKFWTGASRSSACFEFKTVKKFCVFLLIIITKFSNDFDCNFQLLFWLSISCKMPWLKSLSGRVESIIKIVFVANYFKNANRI